MNDDGKAEAAGPPSTPAPASEGFGARLRDQAQKAKEQAAARAADIAAKAAHVKEGAAAKAGEMKDQAVARAGGLADQAAARAGDLADQAVAKASDLKDQAADKAGEIRDAGLAKAAAMLEEFNAALPAIREAGYTLSSVNVAIGLPPKISAGFDVSGEVSEARFEEILAANAERKFTALLMRSLHQAWQAQRRMVIVGLKPVGISVDLGLVPTVSMKFG